MSSEKIAFLCYINYFYCFPYSFDMTGYESFWKKNAKCLYT